jgi:uncharacterized protein (TIGR03905 family)
MKTTYKTSGTCARAIEIELDGEYIKEVKFIGGCRGNTAGISALIKGMPIADVIDKLKGIPCRNNTSCPDQLALALEQLSLQKAS